MLQREVIFHPHPSGLSTTSYTYVSFLATKLVAIRLAGDLVMTYMHNVGTGGASLCSNVFVLSEGRHYGSCAGCRRDDTFWRFVHLPPTLLVWTHCSSSIHEVSLFIIGLNIVYFVDFEILSSCMEFEFVTVAFQAEIYMSYL